MKAEDLIGKNIVDLIPGFEETDFYRTYTRVLETGTMEVISASFLLPDGNLGYFQVNVLPCPAGIQCIAVDVTDTRKTEESLQRQLRYEKVVASVSAELLKPRPARENIGEALTRLLEGTEVSRVYIFENFHDPADGLCMGQTHEVCAPGVKPEIDNPDLKHVSFSAGFQRWREHLSAGKVIWGNVEDFPEEERRVLEPQHITSILVLPLYIGSQWKGMIGFDQIDGSRSWQKEEVRLLKTASDLIGGYLARMEAESSLQRQLKEKEILLKETHHRMKNNIASIAGMLALQAESSIHPEASEALKQALGRVGSMKELYDIILTADNDRRLPAAKYLNDLTDSVLALFPSPARLNIIKSFEDTPLDSKKLFPLGIILNELLTNTMKYAFTGRETGEIKIATTIRGDRVVLTLQDDGRGLPEDFGQPKTSTSLGIMLVKMLAEQMGGTVTFTSGHGTKVVLDFPVESV